MPSALHGSDWGKTACVSVRTSARKPPSILFPLSFLTPIPIYAMLNHANSHVQSRAPKRRTMTARTEALGVLLSTDLRYTWLTTDRVSVAKEVAPFEITCGETVASSLLHWCEERRLQRDHHEGHCSYTTSEDERQLTESAMEFSPR